MSSIATTPGLYFEVGARPPEKSPLRSDIAAFMGRAKRGPVSQPVRVEGWRSYLRQFGGLAKDALMPYAIRGYFENGGEIAYVARIAKSDDDTAAGSTTASAVWDVRVFNKGASTWQADKGGFRASQYRIEATSPGAWANRTRISLRYRRVGAAGKPEVDLVINAPDEPIEYLMGIETAQIKEAVAASSNLIRLIPIGDEMEQPRAVDPGGLHYIRWGDAVLDGGSEATASQFEYLDAVGKLGDEPEVALVAMPDLYKDVTDQTEQQEILIEAIQKADELRDRLVLVDLPAGNQTATEVIRWVEQTLEPSDPKLLRAAAIYHPHLRVSDPLGAVVSPLRNVPPSGHVAGVISWLDRNRGAHHTPANTELYEAVDVASNFENPTQGVLIERGINLIRCTAGRGLQVWGGRTLNRDASGVYIAHRRLIHRLVRAIRRVADPLVFDTNGPELRLKLVRAITTVLLEAYRAGALKGARPEEAFRVRSDETTTPPEEQELGRLFCTIEVAPAIPMEFITLRIVVGTDASLEVFES
ncbi:MAG TPA: phage tail sheath subtilisin-like domain-containing protein [Blastocatellia bacterium]|nr:phage tail sheath subtilisin-like domain-containing protein [Blastocatellia bacterium]